MLMHTNLNTCQKCRSTSQPSSFFSANFNVEMLIPLRTRKSWPSRCFGCKVQRTVRLVFLGSSPKKKELRWVKLHEQSLLCGPQPTKQQLYIECQKSEVTCSTCPPKCNSRNFPQIKPSPGGKKSTFAGQGACPHIDPHVPAQDKMAEGPKPFGTWGGLEAEALEWSEGYEEIPTFWVTNCADTEVHSPFSCPTTSLWLSLLDSS